MNIQIPPPAPPRTASPASIVSNGWPAEGSQQSRQRFQQHQYQSSQGFSPNRRLDTPPLSAALNGGFSGGGSPSSKMNGRGDYRGNPSPPSSIGGARSSNGSAFINDPSAAQKRKQSMMEETLGQHYFVLKRYLASTAQDDTPDAKPSRARDKLPRLSPTQFQELSTDVYDEFQRRQAVAARQGGAASPGAAPPPAYLLPVQGFYPERNQARQKLSTLPAPKFRHLARDVFFELGRRIPRFAAGDIPRQGSPGMRGPPSRTGTPNGVRPGSRGGRPGQQRQGSLAGMVLAGGVVAGSAADGPMQKSLQNNTIIPNKSYLVEDDDDAESIYGLNKRDTGATTKSFAAAREKMVAEYQSKVDELQEKVEDLEKQVEEKTTLVANLETAQASRDKEVAETHEQHEDLRSELEAKVAAAILLNESLQSEIDKARELHAEKDLDIEGLRSQLDTITVKNADDAELSTKQAALEQENQELQQDNQDLQQELLEQQRVTDEVRREAAGFLQEMKTLSAQTHESLSREEQLLQQVHALEDQIAHWKDRFARSKAAKRAADIEVTINQPHLEMNGYLSKNGVIADYHIIEYQVAIDEALRMSRMDPKGLLSHMKSVILAVKHITEDMETADASRPTISKLLTKMSGAACNYITATKNFVYSAGISPVSLVDASASHLTAAIVEAVHEVKMHPSAGVSEEEFVPEMLNKSSKYISTAGRSSVSESVYSTNTAAARQSEYRQPGMNANGTLTSGVYQNGTNGTSTRNGAYTNGNSLHSRNPSSASHLRNGSYVNGLDTHSRNTSSASSNILSSYDTKPTTSATTPSTASSLPDPSPASAFTGFTAREQEDIANLSSFLDDQTTHLTSQIQSLVSTIRTATSLHSGPELSRTTAAITSSLSSILSRTQSTLSTSSPASPLRNVAEPSLKLLASAREKMIKLDEEARRTANGGVGDLGMWKDVVKALPPVAFEVAREVRGLAGAVGRLGDGEDDFA